MNKLLSRQLKNFFGSEIDVPKELSVFVQKISDTYDGFDQDRELTLRSLELSSQELLEANHKIRTEAGIQKSILEALKKATEILQPSSDSKEWLSSKDEILELANTLKKLVEEQKNHELEIEKAKNIAQEERAKAEAILKSIGDGVFAVDLNFNIILMNKIAEEMSGYTFQEAKDNYYKNVFKFTQEKSSNTPYPLFVEEVIQTGTVRKLTNHTLLISKNDTQLPISDSAAPIIDANGDIFGCIVVIRDASREREIEKVKDEFILIAAHQLRTPLGSMRWTIEMLMSYKDIPKQALEKIELVNKENKRMTLIVNDLLNVSQIDQGKMQDKPEVTDIVHVIESVIMESDAEAKEKKVQIISEFDTNIPTIMIDPKRLREVIQNLISNSIKYNIPNGKVMVSAKTEGSSILLRIADEGIGIPLADQERVFTKFYRAANASKSSTTGSGLGLFVVKSYLEKWGGKVDFQSIEGNGSTFNITLPTEIKNSA